MTLTPTRCECGAWSGEPCARPIRKNARTVEIMPEHLRGSHEAAGNEGSYPANGAERLRCAPACAARIVATDGEWARVLPARRV